MEQNEEVLIDSLPSDIYTQIVTLARVRDIQLIIAALDALYFLSELGESMCEAISLVRHCIGQYQLQHQITSVINLLLNHGTMTLPISAIHRCQSMRQLRFEFLVMLDA